jgi:amino acid transporter
MSARGQQNSLRTNALGIGSVTFFVVSAAGPLMAIAGGVPISMLVGNGVGIPASFLLVTAILLVFSAGYTAMARYVTNAGAFYAFAARGLGGLVGGAAAMIAVLSYAAMVIALYGMFGSATTGILNSHWHLNLPWGLGGLFGVAAVGVCGYRQVDLSARLLAGLVVCEYLIVLVLDVAILVTGGAEGVSVVSFTPAAFLSGSSSVGVLFCFAAFVGFEATTIYAEEARQPERTIPIATYASVLLIGSFYLFSTWCVVNGIGASRLIATIAAMSDPTQLLFGISNRYAGTAATLLMHALFVTSVFASVLAFHNGLCRYLFALGRSGLLFSPFARTHAAHQSPHVASAMLTVFSAAALVACILARVDPLFGEFAVLSALATLGIVALMAITSFSVFAFFRRGGNRGHGWYTTTLLPLLAGGALTLVMLVGAIHMDALSGRDDWFVRLLPVSIVGAAVVGIALAAGLRRRAPEHFRMLGEKGR